jgi:hypothetical protein
MNASTNVLSPSGLSSNVERDEIVVRVVRARRPPSPNDRKFTCGTLWVDKSGGEAYILIFVGNGQALWKKMT